MSLPFSLTPKPSNELFELHMPRTVLEIPQEAALYVLACGES